MWIAIATMAITLTPYLFGWSLQTLQPARAWYSWLGYNLDDSCVYLAWMRQAADGSFFQRNLFTTEPQKGRQFNLFFLALGNLARWTHLPLLFVYHAVRMVLGMAFLRAVWWLLELLLPAAQARRMAYLLVCFSAGLGWIPGLWRNSGIQSPVDVWQPEAITFLCLYLSPLFLVSLLLMVGVLGWLWVAEQTGRLRPAIYAGICGLLLGNVHTYDVITLIAIWGTFLFVRTLREHSLCILSAWGRALVAAILTSISTAYTYYLLRTEEIFAQRAAVETLSPPLSLYLLGYGLLIPLALVGKFALQRLSSDRQSHPTSSVAEEEQPSARNEETPAPRLPPLTTQHAALFLCIWAIVNLTVAYLPVSFQRKMLMGEHLPLAILSGVALSWILRRWNGRVRTLCLVAIILFLSLTNVRFLFRDMENFLANRGQSKIQRPYMYPGEVAALEWIRQNTSLGTPIQPLPWVSVMGHGKIGFFDTTVASFAPGLTGRPVHAGHWGETPHFAQTMGQWVRFLRPDTPNEERREFLQRTGVRYLLFTQKPAETRDEWTYRILLAPFFSNLPPFLRYVPEASNTEADVLEVINR
jgi:hypothetical protein